MIMTHNDNEGAGRSTNRPQAKLYDARRARVVQIRAVRRRELRVGEPAQDAVGNGYVRVEDSRRRTELHCKLYWLKIILLKLSGLFYSPILEPDSYNSSSFAGTVLNSFFWSHVHGPACLQPYSPLLLPKRQCGHHAGKFWRKRMVRPMTHR